jgi:hypothetical protein
MELKRAMRTRKFHRENFFRDLLRRAVLVRLVIVVMRRADRE